MSLNSSVQNMTAGVASVVAGILVTIPEGGHHVYGFWKVGVLGVVFTLIAIWMMKQIRAFEVKEEAQEEQLAKAAEEKSAQLLEQKRMPT